MNLSLRRIQGDKVVLEGKDFMELVRRAKRVEEVIIEDIDEDLRLAVDPPLRGSPQAVLSVLDSPSQCTPEEVNALSQEIEPGKCALPFEGTRRQAVELWGNRLPVDPYEKHST